MDWAARGEEYQAEQHETQAEYALYNPNDYTMPIEEDGTGDCTLSEEMEYVSQARF